MSGRGKTKVRNRPWKLGRNDPCSCGSRKKFKKCCLPKVEPPKVKAVKPQIMASKGGTVWKEAPAELHAKAVKMFEEKTRKEAERVARFGQIRPQISLLTPEGYRLMVVRGKLYYSAAWKFFSDFLSDYVPQVLGVEWWKAEMAKPEAERHPIVMWRSQGIAYMNAQPAARRHQGGTTMRCFGCIYLLRLRPLCCGRQWRAG